MFGIVNISAASPIVSSVSAQGGNFKSNLSGSQSGKYSASLDGVDDTLTMFSASGNITNGVMGAYRNWTFAFQVYFPNSANSKTIIWQGANSSSYVWCQTTAAGDLQWAVFENSVYRFNEIWDTNFAADTWYHVVISMDGSGSEYDGKCYVNGTEVNSTSSGTYSTSHFLSFGGTKLLFGSWFNLVFYQLILDEISVWTSALDASNASAIASLGKSVVGDKGNYNQSSSLWGTYRFEEGSGTRASDSSGNSRMDITLSNATFVQNVRGL